MGINHLVATGRINVERVFHNSLAAEAVGAGRREHTIRAFGRIDDRLAPFNTVRGSQITVETDGGSEFVILVLPEVDPDLEEFVFGVVKRRPVCIRSMFFPW